MRRSATLFVLMMASSSAAAGTYPEKELKLVNPYPATGPVDVSGSVAVNKVLRVIQDYSAPALTDVLAWRLRQTLSLALDRPVLLERRARARTIEAHRYVARAAPDGNTLLLSGNAPMVIYPQLMHDLPFDPRHDFTPVTLVARMPMVLIAGAGSGIKSVRQLIDSARAAPGRLYLGSSGDFTTAHLAGELFKTLTGASLEHVAFNGGTAAVRGVVTDQIEAAFVPLPAVLPYSNSARLRLLGIADRERHPALPNLPTIREAGVPGFEVAAWYGLFAPAGTPPHVINYINEKLTPELQSIQMRRLMSSQGLRAEHLGAMEFTTLLHAEGKKWAPVIDTLQSES